MHGERLRALEASAASPDAVLNNGRRTGWFNMLTRRVSIRRVLLLVLVISLAPLAVLAVLQGIARMERDRQENIAELSRETLLAASSEQNVVNGARTLLEVLSASPEVATGGSAECSQVLSAVLERIPQYRRLARLSSEGIVDCSAMPEAMGQSFANSSFVHNLQAGADFTLLEPRLSVDGKEQIIGAFLAIRDANGTLKSMLGVSLELADVAKGLRDRYPFHDTAVILTTGKGKPLAASQPIIWDGFDLSAEPGLIQTRTDSNGRRWAYAQAPLFIDEQAESSLHVVYAQPRFRLVGANWWFIMGYFAMPILALLLASCAIWVAANYAILRWVAELREVAGAIGERNYRFGVDRFEDAPAEIRILAAEMQRMSRTIAERDRTLTESLDRQQSLSLELHHRVRNNLQMIGSYLGMQAKSIQSEEARRSLDQAHLRVSVLGLVHRLLYDNGELTTISGEELLCKLAALMARELDGDADKTHCRAEPLLLNIDAAVPISLWAMEALEWSWLATGRVSPLIRFNRIGAEAELEILVDGTPGDVPLPRLINSIARQLGGRAEVLTDEGVWRLRLRCPKDNLQRNFHPISGTFI